MWTVVVRGGKMRREVKVVVMMGKRVKKTHTKGKEEEEKVEGGGGVRMTRENVKEGMEKEEERVGRKRTKGKEKRWE